MKRSDFQTMRRELETTRNDAVAAAEAQYTEAIEALERLWSFVGDGEAPPAKRGRKRGPGRPRKARAVTPRSTTRTKTTRKKTTRKKTGRRRGRPSSSGTLIDSMRTAVSNQSGQFSISEVKDSLTSQGVSLTNINPAVLSTTMKRLESLGEIKLVKRGKGRRASVYKKK